MYNFYSAIGSVTQTVEAHTQGGFTPSTYLFSILNIIILFYLLKLILFKPITKIMNDRAERIRKDIEEAQVSKAEAEKFKKQYEQRILGAQEEAEQIIENARRRAQIQADEILQKAKLEAEQIINKAIEQGEIEIQNALESAKKQIASLAIQAATKVIQHNMDNEINRKLVEEFLDEVGVA